MSVEDGRLVLPDGMSYRLLVLPDTDKMTPEMAAKIRDLVSAGATVIGPKPVQSPSLANYPACDRKVKRIAEDLWGDVDGTQLKERTYGKGKIIWGKTPEQVFSEMDLAPDFQYTLGKSRTEPNHPAKVLGNETLYSEQLNTIHRIVGKTDLYFVASQSDRRLSAVCTFRINDRRPEFWQPDTGRIEKCAQYRLTKDGRIEVPIRFDPSGSVFVVFREPVGERFVAIRKDGKALDDLSPVQPIKLHESAPGTVEMLAWEAGSYELLTAKEKSFKMAVSAIPAPMRIDGPWEVRFQKDRGAPPEAVFEKLISWPKHADAGIKYFSGTATYVTELTIPAGMIDDDLALYVDIGRVEVIASAELNGKDLGILWKPPFRAEITGSVKPGKNTLKIAVTNLWPNRMIGDEQYPSDAEYDSRKILGMWWREPRFGAQYWSLKAIPDWVVQGTSRLEPRRVTFGTHKFWKKTDPLLDSGLLGPVTIRPAVKKSIRIF